MKVWFKCYKCGKAFEAEERVRTDVCPHCMSFVELSRTERLAARPNASAPDSGNRAASAEPENTASPAAPAGAASSSVAKQSAEKAVPVQNSADAPARGIPPQGTPAEAEADTYDSLYAKAEKMMSFGAWSNAAEFFRQCLAGRENWQARFGLVRAATRELTDLSNFSAVQKDADAAFDKMTAAERLSLGERYVPKLEEKRQSLSRSLEMLAAENSAASFTSVQENDLIFTAKSDLSSPQGEKGSGAGFFAVGILCLVIFVIVATMLFSFEPVIGVILLILGIVGGISCVAIGVRKMSLAKRARAAQQSVQAVSENARQAESAKLKAQIDAIDYLCGFLKY